MISSNLLRRLAFAGLTVTAGPLFAADFTSTWIGGNDSWSAAANWDTPAAPGTLPDNGAFTYDAILSNGGTIALDQNITIQKFTLSNGTLAGGLGLTANESLEWTGGAMSGPGMTNIAAAATLSLSGTTRYLAERTINHAGTATWSAGDFYTGSGAVFANLAAATFDTNFDGGFHYNLGGAAPTFANAGTFTKSGGTGTTVFSTHFNNTGTVSVQTGTLALQGGSTGATTGDFDAAAGAVIYFQGDFDLAATAEITGAGTAQFGGGTINLLSSTVSNILVSGGAVNFNAATGVSSVNLSGGTLAGSGNMAIAGNFVWTGGTLSGPGATTVSGLASSISGDSARYLARALNNTGTMTFSSGDNTPLYFGPDASAPGVLTNSATFAVTAGGDFAPNWGVPGHAIHNLGVWDVSGAGTASNVHGGVSFNNAGTVNVLSGGFNLNGGDTGGTGGTFNVAADASLGFGGGDFTLLGTSSITGAGSVSFFGGNVGVSGAYSITGMSHFTGGNVTFNTPVHTNFAALSGGTVTFNGPVTTPAAGPLTISGAAVYFNDTMSPVTGLSLSGGTLGGSAAITVTGNLDWSGGFMASTGTTTVAGPASTISGGNAKYLGRALTNNGTMTFSSGDHVPLYFGPDSVSSGLLTNHGVFHVTAGGDFTQNWGVPGHAIHNTGVWNVSGAGTVSNVSGGIAFHNTGSVNVHSGGFLVGGGDTGNTSGSFNVAAGADLAFGGGDFTMTATSSITGGGTVNFFGGNTTVNGTYNTTGITYFTGANVTFNSPVTTSFWGFSGGTVTFNEPVTILGTQPLSVTGGNVSFNSTTSTVGGIYLSNGTLGGSGSINATANLDWTGGYMVGSGTTTVGGTASTISGGNGKYLGRALTNNGTMTFSGNDSTPLYFGPDSVSSGVLTNNGVFRVTAGGDFTQNWGVPGHAIHNAGVWNVSGPGTSSQVGSGVLFNNTGTVNVLSGGFALGGGDSGNTTGAFNVSNGALLNFFGGSFTLGPSSSISGTGVVLFSGGDATVNGAYNITGASYFAGGTTTFNSAITSVGTGLLSVSGGTVFFNATTPAVPGISLTGGTLGGSAAITATGNFDWSGGYMVGAGVTTVSGSGSTISTGSQAKYLGRSFTNNGTVTYGSSDGGQPLYFGPDPVSPGVLTNNGTFHITAGGDFAQNYGIASQAIHNAGTWNVSGPGTSSQVGSGIAFNNTGTVNVLSGGLALGGGDSGNTTGAFNVSNAGTLHFFGGNFTLGATSSIAGAGSVLFAGGTVTLADEYDITGGTYFTGGTVTFNAPVTSLGAGPLSINGGIAYFNAAMPTLPGIELAGAGTLGGSAAINATGNLDWTAGTMTGTGTTTVAGLASIVGGGNHAKFLGRALINSGTMTYSTSDNATPLYFGPDSVSPGVLTNNGTFNVSAGGDFTQNHSIPGQAIHNAGIWNVSGAGTTSVVSSGISFHNTGAVHVESGALVLTDGLHGTGGTMEVETGALLALSGTSTFNGASTENFGTVSINGSLTGTTGAFTTHSGALVKFFSNATAGSGAYATHAGDNSVSGNGGRVSFHDNASAEQGTFIANGHGGPGPGDGARTSFFGNSTAASSTLIANGGSGGGAGGSIWFLEASTGGTARVQVFGNGRMDLSGRSGPGLSVGSLEGTGNVFLGANNLNVGANNLSTIFTGVIQDGGFGGGTAGSLTKTGTATLTLGGANAYTGATHVADGRLFINGNHSAATGSVTVDALGTLGGSGVIGSATAISGSLTPGNSAGLLTFNTTLTLNSSATTVMELGGLARGTQYDAVDVGGLFTPAGALQIQMVNGFLPQVGDSFTLLNYGTRAGFFDTLIGFRIAPTLALQPTYTAGGLLLTVETRDPEGGDFDPTWVLPVSGFWEVAANWDSNPFAPNNGASTFDATIGVTGSAYTVTSNTDITIENLDLTSPDATLAHTGGTLQINHDLTVQAGTYSLQGGAIKGATIHQTGGTLLFTYNSNNRLDGATLSGDLNLNQAGGAWVRLQNGASFTGSANIGSPDGSQAVLAYEQTGMIDGVTVNMDGSNSNTYLSVEGASVLTLGAAAVVRGQGQIGNQFHTGGANALINQGRISADLNGRTLSIVGTSFTNTGIAEATNGAILTIQTASFTNSGTFKAASGSTVDINGPTTVAGLGTLTNLGGAINLRGDMDNEAGVHSLNVTNDPVTLNGGRFFGGGTITAAAGLRIGNNSNNRLDGVTLNGALNLNQPGGSWLRLQNGATFTGNANLGSPDGSISLLAYEQTGTLDGVTVHMDGLSSNTYLSIEGTNTLTVGPTAIIRGQGVIGNQFHVGGAHALINEGRISADLTGRTLSLQASAFSNAGILEVKDAAILDIPNGYTQTAGVTRLDDGTLNSGTIDLVAGTLEGKGIVNANVASSGVINLDFGAVINGTLNATGGHWNGQGTVTALATTSVGTFTIGSGANMTTAAGLAVAGSSTIAAADATSTITGSVNYTASTASNFVGAIVGAGKSLTLENAAAMLTLAGPSTYTGATTVVAGTLKAGIASVASISGAFGKDSAVIMADAADAMLDITGFDTQIGSLTGGGANGGNVTLGGATLTLGGDGTGPALYAGTISGSGGVSKIGIGTQTLTNTNTYTGTTAVNAGILQLAFVNLATPSNLLNATSNLTLGGGNLSVLGKAGSGVVTTQTLGSLTLTANTASAIVLDPNNSDAGSTTLTLGDVWTRHVGASLLIDYSSTNTGTRIVKTSGPVTGSGAQSGGIFGYALVKDAGGIGFATQDAGFNIVRSTATGTVLLASNSVAATTAIDFTTVTTDPDYSSVGGTLTLDNVAHAANTLSIDSTGGGTLDLGGANGVLNLTSGAVLMNGDDDYTIQNGALGASGSEVIVHQIGNGSLTISSPISGGAGSLTKDGPGELTLTGPQNYATLTTNDGTTNLEVPLGTGNSTLNANATTHITTSQGLAALNIGPHGVVILGTAGPAPGEPFSSNIDDASLATASIAVPEPGTIGFLALGTLLLGLRSRKHVASSRTQLG